MAIFLEALAASIIVNLALHHLNASERIANRAAELKAPARGTSSAAVTGKPYAMTTALVRTDGTTRPALIRVYADAVYIYGRKPDGLLAYVKLENIRAVGQMDLSRKGHSMAGFAIVTPDGQYQFLHQGAFAVANVQEVVGVIRDTVQAAGLNPVPMLGEEVGYLHELGYQSAAGV